MQLLHEAFVLVNNNLCGKLFSLLESPTTSDESFTVISVSNFITDFYSLSCELDNFTVKVLYWVILCWCYIKVKSIRNTFTVPCEKSKMVSFASSIMENIVVFPSPSRFAVKLIYYTAFGSASSVCCLLKCIAIILQ